MSVEFTIPLPQSLIETLVERVVERLHEQPRWLEVECLAAHYRVPVSRVRFWRTLGLPARRVGKRLIFSVAEVDDWLDRWELA